ncbi:hypothetical protein U5801_28885, partial [Lamprobacter modestohalophilus]|uniref:hypothetical protein n=1 Tax=Lamprobacter modestohalophilus TaxID=1064514 RepID=UPI002ADEAB94
GRPLTAPAVSEAASSRPVACHGSSTSPLDVWILIAKVAVDVSFIGVRRRLMLEIRRRLADQPIHVILREQFMSATKCAGAPDLG